MSDRLRLAALAGDNCDAIPGSLEGELGSPPGVVNERANGHVAKRCFRCCCDCQQGVLLRTKTIPVPPFLYQVTIVLKTKQDSTDRVSLLLVHWGIQGVVLVQYGNHRTDDDDYAGRAARSNLRQGLCETEFANILVTYHFGVFRPLRSCGPWHLRDHHAQRICLPHPCDLWHLLVQRFQSLKVLLA